MSSWSGRRCPPITRTRPLSTSWPLSSAAIPAGIAFSAPRLTTTRWQYRQGPTTPLICWRAPSRSISSREPARTSTSWSGAADAEIERLKRDGPTADEVHRVQIERTRQQGMELDSVTRKASVLNHSAAAHGDPLAYRSVLDRVFKVTPEDVRRVARAYLGPGRIELTVTPGRRAARREQAEPPVPVIDARVIARPAARDDGFDRSITPNVGWPVAFDPPLINVAGCPTASSYGLSRATSCQPSR